jgi:hypothetical protein
MKPRSKLTRSVGGLVLLVVGIVLYVIFPFLELAEKWETAKELAKHIPEFVKSTWFGPVIFLGGLAILTYEKWMAAFHRLIGREPEGEGADKPQLPNLQLDIEEAQVFAKMQFINKQNQTWLFGCNLVVKLHVVNTTSIPCTVRECRASYTSAAGRFDPAWSDKLLPLASQVRTDSYDSKAQPLPELRERLEGRILNLGDGKGGWLRFYLGDMQKSRFSIEKGKLDLKIVDSFGMTHITSVEVPFHASTEIVIIENDRFSRSQDIAEP